MAIYIYILIIFLALLKDAKEISVNFFLGFVHTIALKKHTFLLFSINLILQKKLQYDRNELITNFSIINIHKKEFQVILFYSKTSF